MPSPKYFTGSVATVEGNVLCIPMTLNNGRKTLLKIFAPSFSVNAYDESPYLIELQITPKKPFQAIFLDMSEFAILRIVGAWVSIKCWT